MIINKAISINQSVVLRYGNNINGIDYALLKKTSIAEGTRIIDLGNYRGAKIYLLDLSTLSATGTFKDWLACVTISDCLKRGLKKIVFQSSGNTGVALTFYAKKHGIQTIFFYPEISRYKINPHLIDNKNAITVECAFSESEIKKTVADFAKKFDVNLVPTLKHQIEANKLRANLLLEHYKNTGIWFDWHVQALSSAYGVIGFYEGLRELEAAGELKGAKFPKLLGIQQEAIGPYAEYFHARDRFVSPDESIGKIIEPTLFRTRPTSLLFNKVKRIVDACGGTVVSISNKSYAAREKAVLSLLRKKGIRIGRRKIGPRNKTIEKSGIIALAGALESIENGIIAKGESALIVFTGGSRTFSGKARADYRISKTNRKHYLKQIAGDLKIPKRKIKSNFAADKSYG